MEFEDAIEEYKVSRETCARLQEFVSLLKEWNSKMNLMSKNAIEDVWIRHVADSMQLVDYIPDDAENILDIGSGSGFPGVVLALMLAQKKSSAKIYLVESITKKTVYLKDICKKLGLNNVEIINDRVENSVFKNIDIITARAVASVDKICFLVQKSISANTKLLLPKGKSYQQELEEALKNWHFELKINPNKYGTDGVILELFNVRKKK